MSDHNKFTLFRRSNGIWYVIFTEDDHRVWRSTKCHLKRDALKALTTFKHSIRDRGPSILFSSFTKEFLTYARTTLRPSTIAGYEQGFKDFLRLAGDLRLHSVTPREIERFLAAKITQTSEWTARKDYAVLASAFETARRWKLISENPWRSVRKPRLRQVLPTFFSVAEFQILLTVIRDEQFRDLCILAIFTGMRMGELCALEWSDIDLERKTILVQNKEGFLTKNSRNRIVPLSEVAVSLLRGRAIQPTSSRVFQRKGEKLTKNYVSKVFKYYVRKAKLNDRLHFHSLRHSAGSLMVQAGVPIYAVQRILGHVSIATTQIYAHLQTENLHSEVNKIPIALN
jgi:site-specific recombinase XerD